MQHLAGEELILSAWLSSLRCARSAELRMSWWVEVLRARRLRKWRWMIASLLKSQMLDAARCFGGLGSIAFIATSETCLLGGC